MRAARLLRLLRLLQRGGRVTARELAAELEVSERTVLRDVEALSGAGIPVYAVPGAGGGIELVPGAGRDPLPLPLAAPPPGSPRARVRISVAARRRAAATGRPAGLEVRPGTRAADGPGPPGWALGSFPVTDTDTACADVLALGPGLEVLAPAELRRAVADRARRTAGLHADP